MATGQNLELWDYAKRTLLGQAPGAPGMSVAVRADGQQVAVGGGTLPQLFGLVGNGQGGVTLTRLNDIVTGFSGGSFSRVGFSPDGQYVAATDGDLGVPVFRSGLVLIAGTGWVVMRVPVTAGALVFGTGRRLLVAGLDGQISEWEPDDKALRRISHMGDVHAAALSADGRWLATEIGRAHV